MNRFHGSTVVAALAALTILAQPGRCDNTPGHMVFKNELSYSVRVNILHSKGKYDKGVTLGAGETNSFLFKGGEDCKDKDRQFEILRASDNAKIASGKFGFEGRSITTSIYDSYCKMYVKDGEGVKEDTVESTVDPDYITNCNCSVGVSYEHKTEKGGAFTIQ